MTEPSASPGQEGRPITSAEIRQAFIDWLQRSGQSEATYSDFYAELRNRGVQLRGDSPKRQRDGIYGALLADSRLSRVGPGRFARRTVPPS